MPINDEFGNCMHPERSERLVIGENNTIGVAGICVECGEHVSFSALQSVKYTTFNELPKEGTQS